MATVTSVSRSFLFAENLHLKGSFVIDELNFDKDPVVKVLMGSDLIAGILQLKVRRVIYG